MAQVKASELIGILTNLIAKHGDKKCFYDDDCREVAVAGASYVEVEDEIRIGW